MGIFLLGLYIGRRRIYADLPGNRTLLRRVALWGMVVGGPASVLYAWEVTSGHPLGLVGHSDADVMAHALADALLGAAALGDIGLHFSDKDPQWAGVSGAALLALTMSKVRAEGLELVNADLTLVGERPKIGPFREAMKTAVAAALGVEPAAVNIKATTTEGLGFTGTGEGLAALATVALRER